MIKTVSKSGYKNLIVYQKAKSLSVDAIIFFTNQKKDYKYNFLINQILRSVSSIAANIAEGYGRHYKKSYRQFLAIARGSSFETEHWLEVTLGLKIYDKEIINSFIDRNKEIIKMLTTMMKNLDSKTHK